MPPLDAAIEQIVVELLQNRAELLILSNCLKHPADNGCLLRREIGINAALPTLAHNASRPMQD